MHECTSSPSEKQSPFSSARWKSYSLCCVAAPAVSENIPELSSHLHVPKVLLLHILTPRLAQPGGKGMSNAVKM